MGLLVVGKKTANRKADEGLTMSSVMEGIVKLLPIEAIALFSLISNYISAITSPSEVLISTYIGLFSGLVWVFISRMVFLHKELKAEGLSKIAIVQSLVSAVNFVIYYLLQMHLLSGLGSIEFVTFIEFLIGVLWLAVYSLINYFYLK